MTLNNLGNLYWNLREFKKAEESYTEALKIYRALAEKDPGAYEPDVAMTLNNLGNLYWNLREFKKAEESYTEALKIRRALAEKDPGAYEPDVAMTLNNLGTLYRNLREFKKAEESYTEALQIYRALAEKDPGAYEPYVAGTLNNLGNLYSDLREFKKAEESYTEALNHKDTLPDNGARTFLGLAILAEKTKKENVYLLYFTAGVISYSIYVLYGLPSIDFLHCFQKTQELAPSNSPFYKMAAIALFSLSRIMNSKQPVNELHNFDLDDLPAPCKALVTLLIAGESTHIDEPRNDIEFMFYSLYQTLQNQQ
jgi:tetratricopeptide (TPR) repeat protein